MPHPRLLRGEGLRTRPEQILAESATAYLDEEPVTRKIPLPVKKGIEQTKTFSLGH